MDLKRCAACHTWLPREDFSSSRARPDGKFPYCKTCHREQRVQATFGLTADEYRGMLLEQGGACAICREEPSPGNPLVVDHDHDCHPAGEGCPACVRGILCRRCNVGLGSFLEHPDLLQAAAEYLYDWYDEVEAA